MVELICKPLKDGSVEEVQELVRCKNCANRYTDNCGMRFTLDGSDIRDYDWTEDDGYCSKGVLFSRSRSFWVKGVCAVCGRVAAIEYPYCPWCGAEMIMDGENDETD